MHYPLLTYSSFSSFLLTGVYEKITTVRHTSHSTHNQVVAAVEGGISWAGKSFSKIEVRLVYIVNFIDTSASTK